jgi:hypothetical protein
MAYFNFDAYLRQHKITLSPKARAFCKLGLKRMSKSIDPLHNHLHVLCLLENLGGLLRNERGLLKQNVDYAVLLISVIWHDIWKSKRFDKNALKLMFDQLYEGRGSAKMVAAEMRKAGGFSEQTIENVAYAIRQHSIIHKKRKTIESKMLKDVDELSKWNINRIKFFIKKVRPRKIGPRLATIYEDYFDWFMKGAKPKFYFRWAKREFARLKKTYLRGAKQLERKYSYLLNRKP